MQSITSPTTVAYRPAAMAALAAILITAGFASGMLVASAPLPIAPSAVEAPTTVQPQPGLLEFHRGEWTVGSTRAADQGLLAQRQGEQTVGAAAGVLEASHGLRDQRHGEITAGGSSADQGLLDQRHGEFSQRPR